MPRKIIEADELQKDWMFQAKKQTMATLPEFLRKLTEDYEHDYGTICHAIAAAAIGAAWAVERTPQGGITGFQAGAVMWEIIRGWGSFPDGPKRMQCYQDLLYPQYQNKFTTISKETADWLQDEAAKKVATWDPNASPKVLEHLKAIEQGWIPFGLRIENE